MNCVFCNMPEKGVKHPQDATGLICSNCIQVLLASSQDKIRAAHQLALDKGLVDKAEALKMFIEEEEYYVTREAKKSKRNLVREGPMRMAGPTLDKIGTQQAVE